MKGSVFVAAVLVLAALTATAPAASAQNVSGSLEVASKNTTASDFQNATLTNATILGSGDTASIAFGGGSTASTPSQSAGGDGTAKYGLEFEVSSPVGAVTVNVSDATSGATTAYITTTGGSVISQSPISGGEASLDASSLSTDTTYLVVVDAAGATYSPSFVNGVSYPVTSQFVDLTAGVSSGSSDSDSAFAIRSVSVSGAGADGKYAGANHTVDNAEQATANLTLSDASATITVQEYDAVASSWTDVNQTTVSSTGNHTLGISPTTSKLRTVVDITGTGGSPSAELHDEAILFNAAAPAIDNSSASPTGGIDNETQTLSVNVSDSDFSLAQGESVNVTFEAKAPDESSFSAVGSDTITANGTANTSLTADVGGTWEWRATATGSYGESGASQTFSFSAPANLEIRNESAPAQLVQTSEPVRVEFYFDLREDPQIITRNTTDGELNLTGLPNNQPFTIVVDGGDKYVSRRIFVENIYQRSAVYLLPKNQTQAATVFEVSDFSGSYNQDESALIIQRALNESWQTVEGDLIGANERISTQLRVDQRHRIVILNARTGEQRILGPFTPIASGTQRIQVTDDGQVQLQGLGAVATIGPDIGQLAARQTSVSGSVISQDTDVDAVTLTATYIAPDGSETELASTSASSAGDLSTQIDLTSRANGTVRVTTVYQLADGATGSTSRIYEIRSTAGTQYSLLAVLAGVPDLVPDTSAEPFKLAVSMLLTIVGTASAASAFRMSSDFVGVVAVLLLGGWAVIGWMPYTVPFAAGVAAISVAAVRRGL